MKTWINPQNVLLAILIIMVTIFWLDRKGQDEIAKEYWENPNFKTDSIKVYIDYDKLPKPQYTNYVPPAVNIKYIDPTKSYKTTQVIKNDSLLLIIDSMRDEFTRISLRYLKNNPEAWKILYGEFNSDTVSFDMVNLEGNTITDKYAVNFNRFKYQLVYNEGRPIFKASSPIQSDFNNKDPLSHEFYVAPGYMLLRKSPSVGLDYNAKWRNLRFRADGTISIETNPQLFFKVDAGYKIW
jgi:hypothetical protein